MKQYSYSNNYSKYIEDLKLEKSRKAFRELVESTKEKKNENIQIEDVFTSKNRLDIQVETSNSYKDSDNKEFSIDSSRKLNSDVSLEHDFSEKRKKDISSDSSYSSKISGEISNEFEASLKENSGIKYETELSGKSGKEAEIEDSFTSKSAKELEIDSSLSVKNSNELDYERSVSNKQKNDLEYERDYINKDGGNLEYERDYTNKDSVNLEHERDYANKDGNDLIYEKYYANKNSENLEYEKDYIRKNSDIILEIKKEKGNKYKEKNSLGYEEDFSKKNATDKTVINNYEFTDSIFPVGRKSEEMQYGYYANNFKYYPSGTYSQQRSENSESFKDAIKAITSPSNSVGEALVNSIRVGTDLIDLLNLDGNKTNIYNGFTANNLRWDLKLSTNIISGKDYAEFEQSSIGEKRKGNIDNGNNSGWGPYNYKKEIKGAIKATDYDSENKIDVSIIKETTDFLSEDTVDRKENKYPIHGTVNTYDGLATANNFADKEFVSSKKEDKISDNKNFLSEDDVTSKKEDRISDNKNFLSEDITSKKENKYPIPGTVNTYDGLATANNFADKKFVSSKSNKSLSPNSNFAYKMAEEEAGKSFNGKNTIGRIYVIPPFKELSQGTDKQDTAFSIPLQNSLKFEQISRTATWNAISFFGRIGDVQQYVKTGSLEAINVTTKYFYDGDNNDTDFTMATLQDIEMAYRSLVLPAELSSNYPSFDGSEESQKESRYYYFTRPPLINIELGKQTTQRNDNDRTLELESNITGRTVYKNLFTDIRTVYNENGEFKNILDYKNFVVTNVTIDKNQDENNYYISKEGDYFDTTGFQVTLTLIEIDANYLGSMPSFTNYYNTLLNRDRLIKNE